MSRPATDKQKEMILDLCAQLMRHGLTTMLDRYHWGVTSLDDLNVEQASVVISDLLVERGGVARKLA